MAAVGMFAAGIAARAQQSSVLSQMDQEVQQVYQHADASVMRVTVIQSARSVVEKAGLLQEFDEYLKNPPEQTPTRGGRGRGGGGGPGAGGAGGGGGQGRGGGGDGGNRSDGQPGNPGASGGGFGGGFGGRGGGGPGGGQNIAAQVRSFFQYKAEQAQKAGNADDVARFRGLALRVQASPGGFQGEMLAMMLDNEGHALLIGGVFREAQTSTGPSPIRVTLPDNKHTEATFVGANLFAGYTIIQVKNAAGVPPMHWSPRKIAQGQMLFPKTSGQSFVPIVFAQSRAGEPFSEDRLVSDEQSASRFERNGAFLLDTHGDVAAVVTTGGGSLGDRYALTSSRLQRDIRYIMAQGKDIEPRALGVGFSFVAPPSATAPAAATQAWAEVSKVIAGRRAVRVNEISKDSVAASSGLKIGDLVVSIDGRPISELVTPDGRLLPAMVQLQVDLATRTGDVPLVIVRDAKEQTLQMALK
jgi:S1-C subfamily serine protease